MSGRSRSNPRDVGGMRPLGRCPTVPSAVQSLGPAACFAGAQRRQMEDVLPDFLQRARVVHQDPPHAAVTFLTQRRAPRQVAGRAAPRNGRRR